MDHKQLPTHPETQLPPMKTTKHGDLWGLHGLEDVYFQRETQVNFWSIMGGVAVGALLTQFFPLVEQIRASRWHLIAYFVASMFILINGWVQTSWGALVLKWRIHLPIILPHFLTLICMAIMSLLVIDPAGWSLAAGGVLLFDLAVQRSFRLSGAWAGFSSQTIQGFAKTRRIYFLLMLMCFGASALLFFMPSIILEAIWGAVALLASSAAIVIQHTGMERERLELGLP